MSDSRHGTLRRTYLAILGGAAAIAVVGAVFAGLLSNESLAAPAAPPNNVTEPRVTGTTRVGQVLRTTRGHMDRHGADRRTQFRWFRCDGARGRRCVGLHPDLERADNASYTLRQADAGFRIRSQVIGRNAEGQDTATSNPTAVVTAARAGEHHRAVDLGHSEGRQHARGQPRPVGRRPADHVLVRLAAL